MEWKANIWIELQASNVTNGFDLDHNLDLWNLKVKHDLDLWPRTWPSPWILMVKFWNSCISEWEGRLTLHKGCGSRSFMTMTVTIWWLSSGVWIYQIVTWVTSLVGVPSTHLVWIVEEKSYKWSDCHGMKSKHIDWTPKASNVTIGFDLGYDLDLEFSRSNMEFPISQPNVVRLPRNKKQTYGLNSRPQMWPMGLTLTIILTFEIWRSNMTLTFDHAHDLRHGF